MCVQNGTSIVGMDQKITRNLLKIDIFFCFSDYFGQIYKKRLAKRTVTVGSLKANKEKKIYSNTLKYKDIIFIFEFKNFKKIKYVKKNIDYDKFYMAENKLIPILYDFCMQKNIKLIICMRNENYEMEKKFYKKILFNFLKRKNLKNLVFHSQNFKNSSYKILRKSQVITCIDSSLGLESLGLGHKTIFFSLRSKFLKEKKLYFGWPKKLKFNGFCWINYYSKKKIYSLLNSVYKLNKLNLNKNLKNSNIVDIMYHDHKKN